MLFIVEKKQVTKQSRSLLAIYSWKQCVWQYLQNSYPIFCHFYKNMESFFYIVYACSSHYTVVL